MGNVIVYIVIFVAVYLFASIPWGFIIGLCKGVDIREKGSGNIGATNVNRILGKKFGVLCFFLDFLKGFLPTLAVSLLIKYDVIANDASFAVPIAAFACVAGHIWSIYLKFKGGKGISTIGGVLLGIAPLSLLVAGAIWVAVFYSLRYVSLASICAAAMLPVSAIVFSEIGLYTLSRPTVALLVLLAALAIARHAGNIKRLAAGTENRFCKFKKTTSESKDK